MLDFPSCRPICIVIDVGRTFGPYLSSTALIGLNAPLAFGSGFC